jgi:hypothetical protein
MRLKWHATLAILRRTMKGFVLAAVIGSMRRLLAVVIVLLAIAGASYLGSHKLESPDHYEYGGCPFYFTHGPPPPCAPPTRAAWQIPVAVLIAVVGLGAAITVAGERPRPHAHA